MKNLAEIRTAAALCEIEAQRAVVVDALGSRAAELAAMCAVLQEQNRALTEKNREMQVELDKLRPPAEKPELKAVDG